MYNKMNITPVMLAGLAGNAKGKISCIFLHWTAGYYNQSFKDYHLCIDGDGKVYSMCCDLTEKKAHTWRRNTGSVGIAMNCCWMASVRSKSDKELGLERINPPGTACQPPSEGGPASPREGKRAACGVGVKLASDYVADWGPYPPTIAQIQSMAYTVAVICFHADLPINTSTVMTHAEIAKVDNYGIDSDDPEKKWDLLVLPGTPMSGGDYIRSLAKAYLERLKRRA